VKAEQFMEKLKENSRIRELATNPLLLTLLCSTFEESGSFPQNRSELYQEGLDVLLKKWDTKRNIEREQIYKQLPLQRKEDLLSHIAFNTFERGDYFFKKKAIEEEISDYICNLPSDNTDPNELQLDSEAVLKSIEAQHGLLVERAWKVYSFSHLTFHEFFTARAIALSPHPQQAFEQLAQQLTERRWREVFLLTVGSLRSADDLLRLMKNRVDQILAGDQKLQDFLIWVEQKSSSVTAIYRPAAIRAFYLDLDRDLERTLYLDPGLNRALNFDLDLDLGLRIDLDFDHDVNLDDCTIYLDLDLDRTLYLYLDRALYLYRDRALYFYRALDFDLDCDRAFDLNRDLYLYRALDLDLEPKLKGSLQYLKEQLPKASMGNEENVQQWWQENGTAWVDQLRAVMIQYRNIGYDWQFNEVQQSLLQQYYYANKLLVDCLNSECYVSREVRKEIEDGLLLPIRKRDAMTKSPN
jgi:predicted NACHT family NTPase